LKEDGIVTNTIDAAPALARVPVGASIKVEPLTCTIGAELSGVSLGDASRDDALFAEIHWLLLKHKVLFFRDQDMTRAEHVAFARRFGELEDHPVVGSDPDNPGLLGVDRGTGPDAVPTHTSSPRRLRESSELANVFLPTLS